MVTTTILLIEDNIEAAQLVIRTLADVTVMVARSLREAKSLLSVKSFDLILLDTELPDGNGFEFFKSLRINTPVIMLTSVADSQSVARAFAAGVDDYIAKPFCRSELRARVSRRMTKTVKTALVILGALKINKETQSASVQDVMVDLTQIEFRILCFLALSPNETVGREEIFKTVWHDETSNMRSIDTHVSKLRKKLGADLIESVHGVGYRLAI